MYNTALAGGAIYGNGRVVSTLVEFDSNSAFQLGGGIFANNGANLSNSIASNNTAGSGGFFYASSGDVNFNGCKLTANSATSFSSGFGGGIFVSEGIRTLLIQDTILNGNSAKQDGGAVSINIQSPIKFTARNVTSLSNFAKNNGGFLAATGILSEIILSSVESKGEEANGNGGSVFIVSTLQSFNLSVTNSSFSNSLAAFGGGWFVGGVSNSLQFDQVSFRNNTATEFSGGAIALRSDVALLSFLNCTLNSNSANYQGSAITQQDSSVIGEMYFADTDAKNNFAANGGTLVFRGYISNLGFHNCSIANNEGTEGAGLQMIGSGAQLDILNCNFIGNKGTEGGALFVKPKNSDMKISISLTFFYNNSATNGGATSFHTSPNISHCQFVNNLALSNGGGIFMSSPIFLTSCSFDSNYANGFGGGLYGTSGTSTALSRFISNYASQGGGMYIKASFGQYPLIDGCTFINNTAQQGGGASVEIVQNSNWIFAQKSVFEGNVADVGGGLKLYVSNGTKRVENGMEGDDLTFRNNVANSEGGGAVINGDASLFKCIFEGNKSPKGSSLSVLSGMLQAEGSQFPNSSVYLSSFSKLSGTALQDSVACDSLKEVRTLQNVYSCQIAPISSSSIVSPSDANVLPIKLIVGISVGAGGFLIIGFVITILLLYRKKQRDKLQANSFAMIDFSSINLGEAKKSIINFDEIKIDKTIGSGAFGVVYKGRWRGTTVAVKQIKSENVSEAQLKDFLREIAILKGLRAHPNVVLFIGITFPPDPLSLITEFCEGGGLYEYLRGKDVTVEGKMNLIHGIARGILHLHSEGVIHRDLAVRNILLNRSFEPKVSDFGLSREHSDTEQAAKTLTTLGPIKWMAPEAIFGQNYSIKSDSFSFGVVIWEIIYIQEPWSHLSPIETSLQIKEGKRLFIENDCDPKLSKVMRECWRENPVERPDFSTILDMLGPSTALPEQYGINHSPTTTNHSPSDLNGNTDQYHN